jgi:DNA-directed RNA polymerase subunit RPC12/RpoP
MRPGYVVLRCPRCRQKYESVPADTFDGALYADGTGESDYPCPDCWAEVIKIKNEKRYGPASRSQIERRP